MNQILTDRSKSGFPVSIGTGLSLEAILDPVIQVYDENREVDKIEKDNYNSIVFNVSTLIRNLITSLHSEDISKVTRKDYYQAIVEEIEYLSDLFSLENIDSYFYIHSYKYPKIKYKDKLRLANTPKQIEYNLLLEYILDKLSKEKELLHFDSFININKELKTLLFTHIPWDLLSNNNFLTLHLLESHTGIVKTKKEFNSKYFKIPNMDMSILPFNERLLTTLGDHVMFKPSPLQNRLDLYKILSDKNINAMSSKGTVDILLDKYLN